MQQWATYCASPKEERKGKLAVVTLRDSHVT